MTEQWKPIPGTEGRYEASSCGRIRRAAPGSGTRVGYVFNPCVGVGGYEQVNIWYRGRRRSCYVHSLVAEAFLGPRPEGLTVDHIDANKRNNCPSNLRYVTSGENTRAAHRMGLLWCRNGEDHQNAKLTNQQVAEIKARLPMETNTALGERYGVSHHTIAEIRRGRNWASVQPARN